MRRALLAFVIFAAVLVTPSTQAGAVGVDCQDFCGIGGSVGTYDGGLFTNTGIWSKPGQTPGGLPAPAANGPLIQYRYTPLCDGGCTDAAQQAPWDSVTCQANETPAWIDTRTVNPPGSWTLQGPPECLTAAQQLPFDPGQLQATIDTYFQRIPLPAPKLRIAPADNAVVNLPEIVSADAPAQTTFTVDVAPFPTVTISARVSWEWDFGDGGTLVTSSPGRPYDSNDPDATDYLSHTYRTASEGWPLSVTSVWTATYTVQGLPGQLVVDGTVRRTTNRTLAAAEYGSVLTGN
jgi:hypothetical protein